MRVLLFGSRGMLAGDILHARPADAIVDARSRQDVDIRDANAVARAMHESRPDWVVNCAGLTNVEIAEQDPKAAFAVNAVAVAGIATLCRIRGVRLLHFSTDYVFDGENTGFYDEDDAPRPLNVYGESKLAGERAVRDSGVRHLLIRTQWLFGLRGRSFAGLMCDRARARQPTRAVVDQVGCCTYTPDLARTTWELIKAAEGTLHVANRGKVTRYMLATRIFEHFDAMSLLSPCTTKEFGSPTRRPASSALSVCKAERLLGREMAGWSDALDRYLAEREGRPVASQSQGT